MRTKFGPGESPDDLMEPFEGIKSGIGRARAFLRLSLMQKKLPDYLDLLQSSDQSFRATFWEDWSLIRNDEAPEIYFRP